MKYWLIFIICLLLLPAIPNNQENKIIISIDEVKENMVPISFDCEDCFLKEMERYANNEIYLYGNEVKVRKAYSMLKENGFNVHIYGFSNSSITYSLGCITEIKDEPNEINEIYSYPPSWDWRNAEYNGIVGNWMTSVKSQGNCGSCWDFAAMGALEAIINIREGYPDIDIDLSEQYLLSCPPDSGGCQGWNAYYAYKYIYEHGGALPEDCFPYAANDEIPCDEKCEDWREKLIPIKSYGWYRNPGRDAIKSMVYNHGPVVASMEVYEDFFNYGGGIYRHKYGSYVGGHQVVIVGYNDNQQCWICKNSWGKYWGEDGYFRIAYGECGIESSIVYVDYNPNTVNWPPIARIDGIYYGDINEEIQFTSYCIDPDGDILNYEWDFGDGVKSNEQNPKHAYKEKGIYKIKLTVRDSEGKIATDETVVFVDFWEKEDTWKYVGRIRGQTDIFFPLYVNGDIYNLVLQVTADEKDYYILSFYGYGRLVVNTYVEIKNYNFSLTGKIKNNLFWGEIYLNKSGFGIEKIIFNTRAGLRAIIKPPFIWIPLPVKLMLNADFEDPYTLLTKYIEVGAQWETSSTNASVEPNLILFFIFPLKYKLKIPILSIHFDCVGKETITVPAGSFDAFKIITLAESLNLYYAPEACNIIKIDTTPESSIYFDLQLKSMDKMITH